VSEAVGIIGVGHLAGYLVAGLAAAGGGPEIVLSPRNAGRAAALADRHGARIAGDNSEVAAAASTVIVATRPADVLGALSGIEWRVDHTVVSVAAGVPLAAVGRAVAPATAVRAMPVACVSVGEGPTSLFPDAPAARALLERVGTVHAFADEAAFEAASVLGAFYGWAFALADHTSRWLADAGVAEAPARELVARTLRGATGMMLADPDAEPGRVIESLATPGGITRLGLDLLAERRALEAWGEACEAVLRKLKDE